MKEPCNLIKDLLPLYHDGVCSGESREIIEGHLAECPACREYARALEEEEYTGSTAAKAGWERQKAASFQKLRKKLRRKQLLVTACVLLILAAASLTAVSILKNSSSIVEYQDNLSVSMVDQNLTGRLKGSLQTHVKIKRVENDLFFYVADTKWNRLTTSSNVFSEYLLCPSEKGADEIEHVYYYTGTYENLETLSEEELKTVRETSILLWSK